MELKTMYPASDSKETQLIADISSSDTTIKVTDASVFPDAPNFAVLDTESGAEVIFYNELDIPNNELRQCQRGRSFTNAQNWGEGTSVTHTFAAENFNNTIENISSLGKKVDQIQPNDSVVWNNQNLIIENGSFSPLINGYNEGNIVSYRSVHGLYRRVGNLVYISVGLKCKAVNITNHEQLSITGLPFPSKTNDGGIVISTFEGVDLYEDSISLNGTVTSNKIDFYTVRKNKVETSYSPVKNNWIKNGFGIWFYAMYSIN